MKRAIVVIAGIAVCAAAPAHAQSLSQRGFTLAAEAGYLGLTAKNSSKAVFDSSGGGTFGGELGYEFERFFVTVGARTFSKQGERVFVADPTSPVFKLGHPLEAKITPIQATIGYRFGATRLLGVGFRPYLGAGGGVTKYREQSSVGGISEEQSLSKAGGHVKGGIEISRSHLRLGVEAGYSFVPNTIGLGGVSKVYDEKDIGGFTVLGKIIFATASR